MITELTKEQKARFPEFVEKWTKIGLSTQPANRKEAEQGVINAYRVAGLTAPRIVWCSSPLAQGLTRAILKDHKWASVRDSVGASVGDSVRDSVRASVWDSGYGQHDASWIGFYDFFRLVLGLDKHTEKLLGLTQVCLNAGWFLPHKQICWISERHNILHRNERGRLHKDQGLACGFPDGWGVYALNGIRMKAEQVLTPAEKLEPSTVLAETNADVRRELIRKVGVERMLSKLPHKQLHKRGNYELLSVDLPGIASDVRYLKMLNPSIGVWHLEAVDKRICPDKTVDAVLNQRNKKWFIDAEILT